MTGSVPYKPKEIPMSKNVSIAILSGALFVLFITTIVMGAFLIAPERLTPDQKINEIEGERQELLSDSECLVYGRVDAIYKGLAKIHSKQWNRYNKKHYTYVYTIPIPDNLKDKVAVGCEIVFHEDEEDFGILAVSKRKVKDE